MHRFLDGGRVSRRRCLRWSAGCGQGELVDPRWRVDAELFEDGVLGRADLGALAEGAGRAGEGADGDPVELPAMSSLRWVLIRARIAASRSARSGVWQMTKRSSSAMRTSLTRRLSATSW